MGLQEAKQEATSGINQTNQPKRYGNKQISGIRGEHACVGCGIPSLRAKSGT